MLQGPYFINLTCATTPGNFSCKDDTYILMTKCHITIYSQCATSCEFTSMRLVQVNIMIESGLLALSGMACSCMNTPWHTFKLGIVCNKSHAYP